MATVTDRKLYLGPRLRVLRRELGLNQAQMADELGVSPSYLNHLERNQRPLTAQMLLRLAHTYEIDVRDFVAGAEQAAASDLHAVFADPVLRDIDVPRHEAAEVAENHPAVSEALLRLHRALGDLRAVPDRLNAASARPGAAAQGLEWLGERLAERRWHFAEVDAAAEALSAELGSGPERLGQGIVDRLATQYGIRVETVRDGVLVDAWWHHDVHRRRLLVSERLPAASRRFAAAMLLAQQALAEPLADAIARAAPPNAEATGLIRRALVNYAAAAVVMPYARFAEAAVASRHDCEVLEARFGASAEQVAQRLTTLGRSSARGLPFWLIKVDVAGVVSKRLGGEGAWLARHGGGCARWGVQRAFRWQGEALAALVGSPDGEAAVTVARAIPTRGGAGQQLLILGVPARHRDQVAAADSLPAGAAPVPIGSTCSLCERPRCPDRAVPPITRPAELSPLSRSLAPHPFRDA